MRLYIELSSKMPEEEVIDRIHRGS